jgi:hypothetical protein
MSPATPTVEAARSRVERLSALSARWSKALPLTGLLALSPMWLEAVVGWRMPRWGAIGLALLMLATLAVVFALMVRRYLAGRRLAAALRERRLELIHDEIHQSGTYRKTSRP